MYLDIVDDAGLYGLNAGIFDATIPVAKHVEREVEEATSSAEVTCNKWIVLYVGIVEQGLEMQAVL